MQDALPAEPNPDVPLPELPLQPIHSSIYSKRSFPYLGFGAAPHFTINRIQRGEILKLLHATLVKNHEDVSDVRTHVTVNRYAVVMLGIKVVNKCLKPSRIFFLQGLVADYNGAEHAS